MAPVDQRNLESEEPQGKFGGILSAEQVWNEIGGPPDDPNARAHFPLEAIEAVIDRVVRGYESQAIAEIEQSEDLRLYDEHARQEVLDVEAGTGGASNLGQAYVPRGFLSYFFGEVLAPDGTPLAPTQSLAKVAHTSLSWDDYQYEKSGRLVYVLPASLSSITVQLVGRVFAIESALKGVVPEINAEIIEAAQRAKEKRLEQSQQIERETLSETP